MIFTLHKRITLFLTRYIYLCPEYTIPLKTIIGRSFRQGRSFLNEAQVTLCRSFFWCSRSFTIVAKPSDRVLLLTVSGTMCCLRPPNQCDRSKTAVWINCDIGMTEALGPLSVGFPRPLVWWRTGDLDPYPPGSTFLPPPHFSNPPRPLFSISSGTPRPKFRFSPNEHPPPPAIWPPPPPIFFSKASLPPPH